MMNHNVLDKTVVIAALARNCDHMLRNNIVRIEKLRKRFRDSHVIVIENDSIDDTKSILQEWKLNACNVIIESHDYGTLTIPQETLDKKNPGTSFFRIEKMVKYRNQYLDYIKCKLIEFDYLIILDMDIKEFSVDGIMKTLQEAPQDWGGLFAYGITQRMAIKRFYDVYAFLDVKESLETFNQSFQSMWNLKNRLSFELLFCNFYSCQSSFGGLGIYKANAIKELNYSLRENKNKKEIECLCEHIPFNVEIINRGYKNYISTHMKVLYPSKNALYFIASIIFPYSIFAFLMKIKEKLLKK